MQTCKSACWDNESRDNVKETGPTHSKFTDSFSNGIDTVNSLQSTSMWWKDAEWTEYFSLKFTLVRSID